MGSSTNISRDNENGPAVSSNIRKHDRALKNHKIKLRDVETKLIQALSAKQKNVALSKMLCPEKTKSTEINHRAWLDKKENLTLLTETTKSHQAELEKQQDDTEEKLRNERRRFNGELKKTS